MPPPFIEVRADSVENALEHLSKILTPRA